MRMETFNAPSSSKADFVYSNSSEPQVSPQTHRRHVTVTPGQRLGNFPQLRAADAGSQSASSILHAHPADLSVSEADSPTEGTSAKSLIGEGTYCDPKSGNVYASVVGWLAVGTNLATDDEDDRDYSEGMSEGFVQQVSSCGIYLALDLR